MKEESNKKPTIEELLQIDHETREFSGSLI